MRKILILCLLAFCIANGAKRSLAVLPCIGDFDADGLNKLRDKVGEEVIFNACRDRGACMGDAARKTNANYAVWCKVEKQYGNLSLKIELYNVAEQDLIYTRSYDSYNPKNTEDMAEIIKKELPIAIKAKIVDALEKQSKSPQELCKEKGREWTWDGENCKTKEAITIEACRKADKTNMWIDGVCKTQKQIACENSPGKKWDVDGDVCKSEKQVACEEKDGEWKDGKCKTGEQKAPSPKYVEPEERYTPPPSKYVEPEEQYTPPSRYVSSASTQSTSDTEPKREASGLGLSNWMNLGLCSGIVGLDFRVGLMKTFQFSSFSLVGDVGFLYRALYGIKEKIDVIYPDHPDFVDDASGSEFALSNIAMLKLKLGSSFYIAAGAQMDMPFTSEITMDIILEDDDKIVKWKDRSGLDFGIPVVAGYQGEKFSFDIRTVIGLTDFAPGLGSLTQYGIGVSAFF